VLVTGDVATIKYNSAGQPQRLAHQSGAALTLDSSGNVIVTGGATIQIMLLGVKRTSLLFSD
jgi:hypothetical protein